MALHTSARYEMDRRNAASEAARTAMAARIAVSQVTMVSYPTSLYDAE